ncbi:Cysteine-rich receptor-like protein kinase 15 [Glycine max]|nr:Cysteine-rich receptor-like protein kinase 15 [Glycine max]KAH1235203.1 Cysteine-rich receptor-like protein kinase 15 [Glycine max]
MITSPISRMITKHCIFFCSMHTDLSTNTCIGCLNDEITIPWSSLGSLGGRVLYPSCILRFEFFPFHDLMMSTTIIIIISGHHHHQEMASHIWKIILILTLTITLDVKSSTTESLQLSLAIIEAATDNFSHENKIGKGGFGEVYKDILIDGRPIAVKRLSRNSKQGVEELKDDVLLTGELRHRNLMIFIV